MKWQFRISTGFKNINLSSELIYASYQIERIRVDRDGISILLQGNRPLLEAIELKKPISWKVIEGKINDESGLKQITTEVEIFLTNRFPTAAINSQKGYISAKKSA